MPAPRPPTYRRWTRLSLRRPVAACVAYAGAAVLFTWPLARHLSSKLTGLPSSDLGVYLWNLWVFRHELMAGHSPLFTSAIFSLDPPANLGQHNYTIFSDILAVPLLSVFSLVTSHNIVVLLNMVAAATAMFLLAFHVVRRPVIAWLAGLLFGFSPMLMARSEIHPSLAAAAPLPLFVFVLFRLDAARSARWVVAGGVTLAWAAVSDPYYAIYCGMLAAWYLWTRAVEVRHSPWQWRSSRLSIQVVDGAIAGLLAVSADDPRHRGHRIGSGVAPGGADDALHAQPAVDGRGPASRLVDAAAEVPPPARLQVVRIDPPALGRGAPRRRASVADPPRHCVQVARRGASWRRPCRGGRARRAPT